MKATSGRAEPVRRAATSQQRALVRTVVSRMSGPSAGLIDNRTSQARSRFSPTSTSVSLMEDTGWLCPVEAELAILSSRYINAGSRLTTSST